MTTTHTDSPQTNTPDDDVIATGDLVRLRLKRLADARADYSWRRDETLARYDAALPGYPRGRRLRPDLSPA